MYINVSNIEVHVYGPQTFLCEPSPPGPYTVKTPTTVNAVSVVDEYV